jgi:hypothetical protein
MEEEISNYPSNIKLYEKLRVIGKGAFGYVIIINKGMGC